MQFNKDIIAQNQIQKQDNFSTEDQQEQEDNNEYGPGYFLIFDQELFQLLFHMLRKGEVALKVFVFGDRYSPYHQKA